MVQGLAQEAPVDEDREQAHEHEVQREEADRDERERCDVAAAAVQPATG